jgi:hypothetical protein
VSDPPSHALPHALRERMLSGGESGHRNQVIGFGRVPDAEQETYQ